MGYLWKKNDGGVFSKNGFQRYTPWSTPYILPIYAIVVQPKYPSQAFQRAMFEQFSRI
jgi:hypothetical protein